MLSFFRRFIHSRWGALWALLLLGVIAFAFIAGDITSGSFGTSFGGGGGTAAKAGGASLSERELQERLQRSFENARKANPGLQMDDFLAQGGGRQVYDQLVQAMALKEYAARADVHISKRLIDAQIAAIPAFQDAVGNFSPDLFRQALARERISEQALRDDIARGILERQMLVPATLGVKLSPSTVLPYASLLLEARQGTIAAIPSVAFIDASKPTDAQLADYYKRNADRFTVPEQRRIRYALIDVERFATAAQPTDAEIATYYKQNAAAYQAKQSRSVEQLVLPTEAGAKAIAAEVKGGKTLAAAAQGAGLAASTQADQSLDALTRATSKPLADAAFAAKQGELVGPVRGPLGWVLLRVTAIKDSPARSVDAVRGEIVTALRAQKEKQLLTDFTGKIEDQIAEGGAFDEVVKDNGLKLETTPLLVAAGKSPEDMAYVLPEEVKPLLAPVFGMGQDDDAQLVPIAPDKRYALAAPGEIKPAAPPPLATVKDAIVAQYKLNQGNEKAKALAEQVRAKVAKGQTLAAAIAASGIRLPPPQVVGGRRADLMRGDQRPPAEIAILFGMAANSVKTLPIGQDRGYFVVQLNGIKRGDAGTQPALVKQVGDELAQVVGQEYAEQLSRAFERELAVKRYPEAVARATAALRSDSGAQ
ncbi:MAG: peptidyl-prolyl cis-trans isomerase [Sphingobium sp.]